MTRQPGWADRAAGVLLGTAAGDALGAGYEFSYPGPDLPIGMIGGSRSTGRRANGPMTPR